MNKSNRFSLLFKDTISNTSSINSISTISTNKNVDRIYNNNNNNNNNNHQLNRFVSKQVNDERNKKKLTDNFIKSLDSLTEFPELQIKKKECVNLKNNNSTTFMDAIKMNHLVTNELDNNGSKSEENVPPGCVCIKFDKTSNNHIWVYGENASKKEDTEVVVEENPYFVFQRVNDLYNNRKNEHIRKWGIEEYDKMFMFQNYDYEYFDKLDDEQIEKYSKKK